MRWELIPASVIARGAGSNAGQQQPFQAPSMPLSSTDQQMANLEWMRKHAGPPPSPPPASVPASAPSPIPNRQDFRDNETAIHYRPERSRSGRSASLDSIPSEESSTGSDVSNDLDVLEPARSPRALDQRSRDRSTQSSSLSDPEISDQERRSRPSREVDHQKEAPFRSAPVSRSRYTKRPPSELGTSDDDSAESGHTSAPSSSSQGSDDSDEQRRPRANFPGLSRRHAPVESRPSRSGNDVSWERPAHPRFNSLEEDRSRSELEEMATRHRPNLRTLRVRNGPSTPPEDDSQYLPSDFENSEDPDDEGEGGRGGGLDGATARPGGGGPTRRSNRSQSNRHEPISETLGHTDSDSDNSTDSPLSEREESEDELALRMERDRLHTIPRPAARRVSESSWTRHDDALDAEQIPSPASEQFLPRQADQVNDDPPRQRLAPTRHRSDPDNWTAARQSDRNPVTERDPAFAPPERSDRRRSTLPTETTDSEDAAPSTLDSDGSDQSEEEGAPAIRNSRVPSGSSKAVRRPSFAEAEIRRRPDRRGLDPTSSADADEPPSEVHTDSDSAEDTSADEVPHFSPSRTEESATVANGRTTGRERGPAASVTDADQDSRASPLNGGDTEEDSYGDSYADQSDSQSRRERRSRNDWDDGVKGQDSQRDGGREDSTEDGESEEDRTGDLHTDQRPPRPGYEVATPSWRGDRNAPSGFEVERSPTPPSPLASRASARAYRSRKDGEPQNLYNEVRHGGYDESLSEDDRETPDPRRQAGVEEAQSPVEETSYSSNRPPTRSRELESDDDDRSTGDGRFRDDDFDATDRASTAPQSGFDPESRFTANAERSDQSRQRRYDSETDQDTDPDYDSDQPKNEGWFLSSILLASIAFHNAAQESEAELCSCLTVALPQRKQATPSQSVDRFAAPREYDSGAEESGNAFEDDEGYQSDSDNEQRSSHNRFDRPHPAANQTDDEPSDEEERGPGKPFSHVDRQIYILTRVPIIL